MSSTPYLSVIMPAYNEVDNFKRHALDQVYEYLSRSYASFELLLVDDGSEDETLVRLKQFAQGKPEVQVIASNHQGKGPTVKKGMMTACGQLRLFTDFDQSTPIQEIEKLIPFIKRGYDIVIGSREIKGAKREAEPLHRHLMGKGFNVIVKLFTVRGIQDTQCGFKLFDQNATNLLFPKLKVTVAPKKAAFTGAFDVELLFLAQKKGLRIAEVPVQWKHEKSRRVNPIKDSVQMFLEVLRIRLTDIMDGYA